MGFGVGAMGRGWTHPQCHPSESWDPAVIETASMDPSVRWDDRKEAEEPQPFKMPSIAALTTAMSAMPSTRLTSPRAS